MLFILTTWVVYQVTGWIAGSSHGYNSCIRVFKPGQTRRSAPTFVGRNL
ncbi:MAG: hypothetical protein WD098_04905 [Balneolales bacterium]